MSDAPQGPGWWQASDGKWYPPESAPPPAGGSPYGAPGYPATGYPGAVPPRAPSNGKAIAALVCGIVSIPLCCIGFIPGAVAIFLGWSAKAEIDKGTASPDSRSIALAGFICGIVGTVIWVGYGLFWTIAVIANAR